MTADGIAADDDTFYHHVRILHQDVTILESSRFRLIGVHGEINRLIKTFRQKAPFHPGGKTRPAAAPQATIFHFLRYINGLHVKELVKCLVGSMGFGDFQEMGVLDVKPGAE